MKSKIAFLLLFVLAENVFASLGDEAHSSSALSLSGYQTTCLGEGCSEESFVPSPAVVDAEYVQARIVPGSAILSNLAVENMETGEVVKVSADNREIDFLTADGSLAEDITEAAYVLIPNYYFPSMAQEFAGKGNAPAALKLAIWHECRGDIVGRYVMGRKCSDRPIHPSLLSVMEDSLLDIVGGRQLILVHKGIMGDARHAEKKSLHNTGRAIDVAEMIVDGKRYVYEKASFNPKSSERAFFLKVMAGWEAAVKRHCGSTVAATTINWTNKDHRHHIHLGTTYNCR